MKAGDIAAAIERFAPLDIQEDWDNSGFCIGAPEREVHGAVIGLDCTPELFAQAHRVGADMVITHHPLIFNGIKKISENTFTGRLIMDAINEGLTVYSCHTNMDKVFKGVSGVMATRLGLKDLSILDDEGKGFGLGMVGTFEQPLNVDSFINLVKETFHLPFLRTSKPVAKLISKVALCGGSAGDFAEKAHAMGADAYLCGDISYHHFFCEPDMMLMDVGHFESEIDIVSTIYDIIREKFPTFAVQIVEKKNNPVYYY